ncbi:MAG: SusE domain-containing protein, partial [Bacteroidota bacterium]
MKHISQYVLLLIILIAGFTACQKADKLPFYGEGSAPQLSASATVVNPPPADSNKVVLTLNWTDPGHAQDKSLYKYYLEVDSSGRNFSKATIINVTVDKDKRTYAFVAKDLNNILLSYGFQFNVAYDIDVRVVSSYGNNNEQKKSNTVKVKATPYKIPPKVTLPSSGSLFIVGAATQGDWNNPVPVPTQEFQKIDETTYGGIFQLNGGQEYLLLPVNGSWDTKYAISDNMLPGVADEGSFFFSSGPGSNFKAPANSGVYKITVDFQLGKYKVESFTQQHGLPTDLFIVGNATPGDWV